jgi:hypothetical protein
MVAAKLVPRPFATRGRARRGGAKQLAVTGHLDGYEPLLV